MTGKHALISGGGSGIGLAVAKTLASRDWRITIVGRSQERLDEARQVIPKARAFPCDVTSREQVAKAVSSATAEQGTVDLLVNNAGSAVSAPFEKQTPEAWDQAIQVNLMGAVHCIQATLPGMRTAGWGRIVNIASTAGLVGYRYVAPYVAAKHALVGLTKSLALELAKTGITVNAICPGYTDTAMMTAAIDAVSRTTGRSLEEAARVFTSANPQGRLIAPAEVAAAVLWLASSEATSVNGIALPISGGEVM